MANTIDITQELVREYFDYKDGFLYRKISPKKAFIGRKATSLHKYKSGDRRTTSILNRSYLSSRLIFLWHKGYMPEFVDHINNNQLDDHIENLREATRNQNNANVTSHKNCTSKYLGVYLKKRKNRKDRWVAQIKTQGKQIELGRFKEEGQAAICYNKAALQYHGEFANLNIVQ